MDRFTRDDLRGLLRQSKGPCVSLFARTTRGAAREDKTRWKNLVREAEERLKEAGRRIPDAKDLLAPARAVLDDVAFWQNMPVGGLAGFFADGEARWFRVPIHVEDGAFIGGHFQVRPLLPLLAGNGRFFVLTLSQKKVRFLQATRHSIAQVPLENVPESFDEAMFNTDEGQTRSNVNHPRTDPRSDKSQEIFRGRGNKTESAKDGLREYCQRIDHGLQKYLADERGPLVLATVEYMHARYKEANSYKHLLDESVEGNPDLLSDQELQQRAWALAEPHLMAEQNRLLSLFGQLTATGTGLTVRDLPELVSAAYRGQLQYLFIPAGAPRWGRFNADDFSVDVHDVMQPGDEDLVNLATVHALAHKTTVFAVDPAQMPEGATHAAGIYWLPLGEKGSGRVVSEVTA